MAVRLIAFGLCATGCSGINSQTHAYATLAQARQAGAITSGWLPDGLPAGSSDIRTAHVPGTSERWGVVNFPPSEGDTLRTVLDAEELTLTGLNCRAPGRIEWWPTALRGRLDGDRLAATGIRGYRARQGDLIVAVNWAQGRAYYWPRR